MALFDELCQRQKAEEQKAVEEELSRLRVADELVEDLDKHCQRAVHQYLRAAGFHLHHRTWRKKRQRHMGEETTEALIQRAEQGDQKALAQLQQPPHADSTVLRQFLEGAGQLTERAIELQLDFPYGNHLVMRAGIRARLAELESELARDHPALLERLLIGQLLSCWVEVHIGCTRSAMDWEKPEGRLARESERRYERALTRLCRVARTLSQVRRLLGRPDVNIQFIERQLNIREGRTS
jgi:hypothetical protein